MLISLAIVVVICASLFLGLRIEKKSHPAVRKRSVNKRPQKIKNPLSDEEADEILGLKTQYDQTSDHNKKECPDFSQLITLHVVARLQYPFTGYELLQSLLANGLRYGEMNIFHYHQQQSVQNKKLFSLAAMEKPGTFDLSNMGSFSCVGLSLFMLIHTVSNPNHVFKIMLETAQSLADELGGYLLAGDHQPLNDSAVTAIKQRIQQFKESQTSDHCSNSISTES